MQNGNLHKIQQSTANNWAVLPENQYCEDEKVGIVETMITVDFHQCIMLNMTKMQQILHLYTIKGGIIHTILLTYEEAAV
jgi:hypothetical protein